MALMTMQFNIFARSVRKGEGCCLRVESEMGWTTDLRGYPSKFHYLNIPLELETFTCMVLNSLFTFVDKYVLDFVADE